MRPRFNMADPGEHGVEQRQSWHAISVDDTLALLQSDNQGLDTAESRQRLAEHGPNRLPVAKGPGLWLRFLRQFKSLLIYVLLGAAALNPALGHGLDAAVIMGVVLVNAAIGFVQEGKAEKALEAIRSMIDPKAPVLRAGERHTVRAEEIVPGDTVLIEAGDRVPAELRLVRAHNLRIDEAALTGESVAVGKSIVPVAPESGLGDRRSMAFSGTLVSAGQAAGVALGHKGTEAAKEAAEMVLADDNFASIVAAVREGRTVYDNLKKVIAWTLPTNVGEAMTILGAIGFGLALPITPVQILWVNMITAVALGLALAFEPTEPGTMQRRPRPAGTAILSGELVCPIGFVSALFVAGAFGVFFWAISRDLPIEAARTLVVNTLVVFEIFYLFSIRFVHGTSLTWRGILGTPAVLIGVGVAVLGQLLFTYAPFMQAVFATSPVAVLDGLAVIGTGVVLLVIMESEKALRRAILGRGDLSILRPYGRR